MGWIWFCVFVGVCSGCFRLFTPVIGRLVCVLFFCVIGVAVCLFTVGVVVGCALLGVGFVGAGGFGCLCYSASVCVHACGSGLVCFWCGSVFLGLFGGRGVVLVFCVFVACCFCSCFCVFVVGCGCWFVFGGCALSRVVSPFLFLSLPFFVGGVV